MLSISSATAYVPNTHQVLTEQASGKVSPSPVIREQEEGEQVKAAQTAETSSQVKVSKPEGVLGNKFDAFA